MLSRPPVHAFLPSRPPRKHVGLAGTHAFAGWGRDIVSETVPRKHGTPEARGPSSVAVVQFDLAARRRSTPMRVRPTDPCRTPWPPYGLGRRPIRSADRTANNHAASPDAASSGMTEGEVSAVFFAAAFLRQAITNSTAIGSTDTATMATITISKFFFTMSKPPKK
jgi:hypothetical protein